MQKLIKWLKTEYVNIILGLFMSISSIAIATIITLKTTFIYNLAIEKFNLTEISGLSKEELLLNYYDMINYLSNPFIDKLELRNFSMSITGEIHFFEVKRIFMVMYFIIAIFIGTIIILRLIKNTSRKINLLKMAKHCSNVIIILLISITFFVVTDFSKSFQVFHKIFFKNNYWVFNSITDPIISVLPENLFVIYTIIILSILLIESLIIDIIYRKKVKYLKY